jgi:anthranilate/para-aminobenzoate synthase component II
VIVVPVLYTFTQSGTALVGQAMVPGQGTGPISNVVVTGKRVRFRVTAPEGRLLEHDGTDLFDGLPRPLRVMRYHSLVVEPTSLPAALEVTARATDSADEIHALRHRVHPVWGVQFHPESVLTEAGHQLLANFLRLARQRVGSAV